MKGPANASPMMLQWQACKQTAGKALLLFRMGDFYEAFYDDAITVAKELELTLTKRQEIPMSGVPHHTSDLYIDKLVAKGYRVAIAEQLEDAKAAKGLVRREVVRIVTPGTLIASSLLSENANNFVAAVARVGQLFGIAILDLTTADFRLLEVTSIEELLNEIHRLSPSELVIGPKLQKKHEELFEELRRQSGVVISSHDDWRFEHQVAHDFLAGHFKVTTLDGFGLRGMVAGINAAGGLLSYLQEILSLPIDHVATLYSYATSQFMSIDRATERHLEITQTLSESGKKNTLLHVLDHTCTPMGARLLRRWMKQPLVDIAEIRQRQEAVHTFFKQSHIQEKLSELLDRVRDIERLIIKISSGYATPRDIVALKHSYLPLGELKSLLQETSGSSLRLAEAIEAIDPLPEMTDLIQRALEDEPPLRLSDGKVFRQGYHGELDELRSIGQDSHAFLLNYQIALRETTGIKTLKVGFTRLSGYYIEVSRGQADKVPVTFSRRQTLVNTERYMTQELKEFESKVLHAEERIAAIETELFSQLRNTLGNYAATVQKTAQALAIIDVLQSLARAARLHGYRCPVVDDQNRIKILGGRHPVIEAAAAQDRFIPNDTLIDEDKERLLLITGPNMAGKSTYIRQVALIVIMAQIGSFVPAAEAHIGIVDRVFSRIGASDDLSRGQSTFMVEMAETANILNNATERSLVILDEIGRGTSTYDGISIAWAVAEHLLVTEERRAKTLFATHYWELTKLEEKIRGAINYHVAVHEGQDGILFLRKIVRGGTDKSYGIHVAKLAGLPPSVLSRAGEILAHLEENANRKGIFEPAMPKRTPKPKSRPANDIQLTFFG